MLVDYLNCHTYFLMFDYFLQLKVVHLLLLYFDLDFLVGHGVNSFFYKRARYANVLNINASQH